ncbi:hypothetical protein AA313_de0203537 [Arthrobotrys entomopaga]|nr:hypothetical protein AA313_de0203537 [Arthrobotrys entomopaga]
MTATSRRRTRRKKAAKKAHNEIMPNINPTSIVVQNPSKKKPTTPEPQIPNILLLGFQMGKPRYKDILKLFADHGVTDRGKVNGLLQEQWRSCPEYTDALRMYWVNIQKEQNQFFALIRRGKFRVRSIRAQKTALSNKVNSTPARAVGNPFKLDNDKVKKKKSGRNKIEFFNFALNSKTDHSSIFGGENFASGSNKIHLPPAKPFYSEIARKTLEGKSQADFFINGRGDKWVKLKKKTSEEELDEIVKRLEGIQFE